MLQMKFKPRFIEAFVSGQKTTTLRMMDFRCFQSDHDSDKFFHRDTLSEDITIPDYSAGATLIFDKGTVFTRVSNLAGLLKRQPYQPLSNIELVTETEGGEWVPFAIAFIADISVIKGDQITDQHAITDGFNPEKNEMYWLYTFTNIQMLSQWRADA
ncbi:hypothetical protein KW341_000572 [Salmonella enterica]|nr:hypothetical protein [Salmonella enterica]